jgi:hypothetical protein
VNFSNMSKTPENLQPENWHRYFAITANNAAWNMSESLEDVLNHTELLDAAHASAWHWRVVGTTLNQMRSTMLLALIHARMDMGPSAWRYAESMKKYFTEIAETPDWELAFVYAIHAWAALACGKLDEYKASYHKATTVLEAIKDPEDRAVVIKTFNLIPKL